MRLYRLKDYLVLRLKPKAEELLQGLSTNTAQAPSSAFLDVQGKVVATAFQTRVSADEVLLAVGRPFAARLSEHLKNGLFLADAALEETRAHPYFDLESGRMVTSETELPAPVSEEEFTLYRLRNHLPLQGVDHDREMVLTLGDEKLMSFDKGCYLGQEIVARVHFKSRPPKILVVKFEEDCSEEERLRLTSRARDPETGRKMGFVFVENRKD